MATVRPLIPPRPLRPEAQDLLRQVLRLRMRTRLVAVLGLALAAAGCAAIVASSGGVPLLAALLPIGLAIALLAERRLARLSAVDRRVHMSRGRDLTLTAALLGWGGRCTAASTAEAAPAGPAATASTAAPAMAAAAAD